MITVIPKNHLQFKHNSKGEVWTFKIKIMYSLLINRRYNMVVEIVEVEVEVIMVVMQVVVMLGLAVGVDLNTH